MKNTKILPPIMLLLFSAGTLQAQYSHLYYHRTGDTIQYDSPIYYHNRWGFEDSYHTRNRNCSLGGGGLQYFKMLSYYFTPAPLEVIGMAMLRFPEFHDFDGNRIDTTHRQEYLYLYEADTDSIWELKSVPWDFTSPLRYIHLRGRNHGEDVWGNRDPNHPCCDGTRWDRFVPVAEYYFDTPVYVYDSFYVGVSNFSRSVNFTDPVPMFAPEGMYWFEENLNLYGCERDQYSEDFNNSFCGVYWPSILIYFDHPGLIHRGDTIHGPHFEIPLVFPIIRVDTTVPPAQYCPPVENLRVENLGSGTVQVSWDAHPDHRYGYDVQTGSVGQPTSTWTTRYSEQNFIQIDGLQAGRGYYVRVRGFCDSEEIDISDWCQAVGFTLEDSTTAILQPSALSQHTTLHPNPATGSVAVSSDYVILSLDLYDAAGRHLWNQPVGSQHISIDLSALPAGRYLLMVSTPAGTTPKTLIKY